MHSDSEKPGLGDLRLVVTVVALMAGTWCHCTFGVEPDQPVADFTYETDPAKVILFVCSSRADKGIDSMTVYGNGRVELRAEAAGQVAEEHELSLGDKETEALLRLAVDSGLAEYDSERIRERQLRRSMPPPRTDGQKATTVLLSLASYKDRAGVEQTVRFESAGLSATTDIPEIGGVAELRRRMLELHKRAKLENAPKPVEPDYNAASFTFSADPSKVVLSTNSVSGFRRRVTSMVLYGDGRVEIRVEIGGEEKERYEEFLVFAEVEALLRETVSHGLAEYDSTSVRARQYRQRWGRPYSGVEDGSRMAVSLLLETYTRDAYARNGLTRSIQFDTPRIAARAVPEITEIRGLAKLQAGLFSMLDRARMQQRGDRR